MRQPVRRPAPGGIAAAMATLLALLALLAMPAAAADRDRLIRAAHILISPGHDPSAAMDLPADDPGWTEAEAAAGSIAAELRAIADPGARAARFAELARERSDDTFSGAQGGDLGAFPREMMVPGFADPLFDAVGLEPGDIVGPARTEFGWHVILYQGEGPVPSFPVEPTATPAPTPGVALVDPGEPPRVLLRYAPAPGSSATLTMTSRSTIAVTTTAADPVSLDSATTMTWQLTEAADAGPDRTRMRMTLTDVILDGDDRVMGPAGEQLEAMVGLTGTVVSDRTGKVVEVELDLPKALDPMVARAFRETLAAFEQSPAVVPDEPVGVGATWESVTLTPATELSPGGVSRATTTITAIDGSSVTTRTRATSETDAGQMAFPGMPEGMTLEVMWGDSTSEGTATTDLRSLRTRSEVTGTSTLQVMATYLDQDMPMSLETSTTLTLVAE